MFRRRPKGGTKPGAQSPGAVCHRSVQWHRLLSLPHVFLKIKLLHNRPVSCLTDGTKTVPPPAREDGRRRGIDADRINANTWVILWMQDKKKKLKFINMRNGPNT